MRSPSIPARKPSPAPHSTPCPASDSYSSPWPPPSSISQSIYLKVMWRYGGLLVLDSPFLLYDFLTSATPFDELVTANFTAIFFLSMLNSVYVYMVYNAIQCTFAAHTLLLCSIATTFSTTWKIASKRQFSRLEYLGIAANVFGAYLCCCEGGPLPRITCFVLMY